MLVPPTELIAPLVHLNLSDPHTIAGIWDADGALHIGRISL